MRLREDYVPAAFDGVDVPVYVTGATAFDLDYTRLIDRWLPIVITFVLGLSFLLLLLVFRSIVLPLKAVVLNLLSVGAAYGVLVLVFQEGVGADLLGLQQIDRVEPWVPVFLFSVLFALSMDYHVFLLTRIRERYLATGDTARRRGPRGGRHRSDHHRRGPDHRRGLLRLRDRRHGRVPADGPRRGSRAADRRDRDPDGARAVEHGAAGPLELVSPDAGSSGSPS